MKKILITGATGNLGKAVLAAFKKDSDFQINITARESIKEANHLKAFQIDLMDETSTAALVDELAATQKPIDAAVFLTGAYIPGDITGNTSSDIQKMVGINVTTAHNLAAPLMKMNRKLNKPLQLIFIGAKAAMSPVSAIENAAYALSKKMLFNYAELINESENKYGTVAHIILPGTLNTLLNREQMPNADFSQWTMLEEIILSIEQIISGEKIDKIITL